MNTKQHKFDLGGLSPKLSGGVLTVEVEQVSLSGPLFTPAACDELEMVHNLTMHEIEDVIEMAFDNLNDAVLAKMFKVRRVKE